MSISARSWFGSAVVPYNDIFDMIFGYAAIFPESNLELRSGFPKTYTQTKPNTTSVISNHHRQ